MGQRLQGVRKMSFGIGAWQSGASKQRRDGVQKGPSGHVGARHSDPASRRLREAPPPKPLDLPQNGAGASGSVHGRGDEDAVAGVAPGGRGVRRRGLRTGSWSSGT